jgi:hypothetical protein
MSDAVEERLGADGVTPVNMHAQLAVKNSGLSLLWLETWAREAFLGLNSRRAVSDSSITLNFSQVISLPCLVWYLQGPPSLALRDMEEELSTGFRIAYNVLRPVIDYADERLVNRMGRVSASVVANSKFCASMYSDLGVRVHDVIYPPINCNEFRPSTSNPSGDYVLTYFGKETEFSVVKRVADMGVKIKAFGSKTPYIERDLKKHPNIEFLGRVTTSELVDLYSNALFTIFPFTHEPFGYIPLESMACGTPSLTYDIQGPSEYVANDYAGWLAHTKDKLVYKAVELWKKGYPSRMRLNSVRTALKFDKKFYLEKWLRVLSGLHVDIASHERRVKSELLTDSAPDVPLWMEDTCESPKRNV